MLNGIDIDIIITVIINSLEHEIHYFNRHKTLGRYS